MVPLRLDMRIGLPLRSRFTNWPSRASNSAGVTQGIANAAHAVDVTVVVATPDVDDMVNALELIPVIGNVGGEVGVLTIGLHQNAVLVVAQIGGTEPQGAVLVVG